MGRSVAVVTGASRGIGRQLCGDLAQAGWDVVCVARSSRKTGGGKLPGNVEDAAEDVEARGGKAMAVVLDVRDEEAIAKLATDVYRDFGRCDLLVNNAAVAPPKPAFQDTTQRWRMAVDVNVNGPFYLSYYLGQRMLEAGEGRIVNISSGVSVAPSFGRPSYTTTKRALEGMSESLAYELRGKIAVNCIRIEVPVLTDGFSATLPEGTDTSSFDDPVIISQAVIWLAGQKIDYTGEVLTVGELKKLGAITHA